MHSEAEQEPVKETRKVALVVLGGIAAVLLVFLVLLATRTEDEDVRQKVLAVTFGWAGLNALAVAIDSARAR